MGSTDDQIPVRTREDDPPEMKERLYRARREGRRRTVIISVVASGIVALFIGRAVEVQVFNEQRQRSITNCEQVQEDRRSIGKNLQRQADGILGSKARGVEPFDLTGTGLEKFEPLLRAQAIQNRARAQTYFDRIENCNKVFPSQSYFGISL